MEMSDAFVGNGWAFPVRVNATGGIALVSNGREIEESIRLILGTAPGERPMRPEFGCRIHHYLFSSSDATTAGMIAEDVRFSLLRWEPRIDVLDINVGFDELNPALVYIDVRYRIRSTNDARNLVFPFYSIPVEQDLAEQDLVERESA
jgi:phage baseplate assembly protein W